jgi:hypothetical protein
MRVQFAGGKRRNSMEEKRDWILIRSFRTEDVKNVELNRELGKVTTPLQL